jgi:putative transposase
MRSARPKDRGDAEPSKSIPRYFSFKPQHSNWEIPMKRIRPYLKMRVLGAIEHAPGDTYVARIKLVASQPFMDNGETYQFTWRTIQTWWSRYKKDGETSATPRFRSDKGKPRKVEPEELLAAIEAVLPTFRGKTNMAAVYRACIEQNHLRREHVAPNTFRRLVKQFELMKPDKDVADEKPRLAFAKAHANELWQADTMHGPYVKHAGGHVPAKLIAFLDDASRVCCHAEFFLHENTDTLIRALKSALYKRGIPQALYVDNGSIYSSKEIAQICARIGCLLGHAPLRDGAAKGKVERFFRTVRESFLIRELDLSSIDALNKQFRAWLEDDYNGKIHATLKMRPIDRFGLDLSRVRYLSPNDQNQELFFVEEERTVLADNTFSFRSQRFEAPRDLRSRKVQIRFDRQNPSSLVVVFYKGDRMGQASLLDRVANDRKPGLSIHNPKPLSSKEKP